MASTSSPYGFQPISHQTGTPRTTRMPSGIASGFGTAIYKFQPIKLVSGLIQPITAGTDAIFGVFAGVEYTPTGGRPTESPYWPASATYDSTLDMFVYFWPAWDATLRFRVQADGSVAQAKMGQQFNTTNITNNSTPPGLSTATVGAGTVTTGVQGQWFLEEFDNQVNDAVGDAFTDLIVGVARNQIGPAVQVSL